MLDDLVHGRDAVQIFFAHDVAGGEEQVSPGVGEAPLVSEQVLDRNFLHAFVPQFGKGFFVENSVRPENSFVEGQQRILGHLHYGCGCN